MTSVRSLAWYLSRTSVNVTSPFYRQRDQSSEGFNDVTFETQKQQNQGDMAVKSMDFIARLHGVQIPSLGFAR